MKRFLLILVIAASHTLSYCQKAVSNESIKMYGALNLGLCFNGDDIFVTANTAMGCQFRKWLGLGINIGAYSKAAPISSGYKGAGLEYRLRIPKRWVWTLSTGIGFRSFQNNDSYGEIRSGEKRFPFYTGAVGYKLGKFITLSYCIWLAEPKMEFWREEYDSNQMPYLVYANTHKVQMNGCAFTLGFNIN